MDALELIGPEPDTAGVSAACRMLESAQGEMPHQLKTRVSALLQGSPRERAFGAVIARYVLRDFRAVASHGAKYATMLLRVLDLPEIVCWAPATLTLAELFKSVHNKPALQREVANSRVADFMKRLVRTLPVTNLFTAASEMLRLYPAQCRPNITKLAKVLEAHVGAGAAYATACLSLAERQPASHWRTQVDKLTASLNERNLELLMAYLSVAAAARAEVPAAAIVSAVLNQLKTLKSTIVSPALQFVNNSFALIGSQYVKVFDQLLYALLDAAEMGRIEAVLAAQCLRSLVSAVGWIPESFSKPLARGARRLLDLLAKREFYAGAEGLADFAQNKALFATETLTSKERKEVVGCLAAVAVAVPTLPLAIRVRIDKAVLESGNPREVALVTLHPGKYSVLPLAIARLPDLNGLECLVHPRLPPLHTSADFVRAEEEEHARALAEMGSSNAFSGANDGDVEIDAGDVDVEIDGEIDDGEGDAADDTAADATNSATYADATNPETNSAPDNTTTIEPKNSVLERVRPVPSHPIEPPQKKVKLDEPESDSECDIAIPPLTIDSD